MTIFDALVAGYIRRQGVRAAVTVAAIALAVAVYLALRLADAHATAAFAAQTGVFGDEADFEVDRPGSRLSTALLVRIRDAGGVRRAIPQISGTAFAGEKARHVVRVDGYDLLAPLPRAFEFRARLAGPFEAEGTEPEAYASIARRGAIVSRSLADRLGLHVGDALPLVAGGTRTRLPVVAVPSRDGTALDADTVLVDVATAAALFDTGPHIDRIACVAEPGQIDVARRNVAALLPPGARLVTAGERRRAIGRAFAGFAANLDAFGALTLLLACALVYDAIGISVLERRGEIGTLRALGASRGAIAAAFVAEGALFGCMGSLLGIGLGTVLAARAGAVAAPNDLYALDRPAPLEAYAIGVVLAMLAAAGPAIEAARRRPAGALSHADARGGEAPPYSAIAQSLAWIGLAGAALATLAALPGARVAGVVAGVAFVAASARGVPFVLWAASRAARVKSRRLPPSAALGLANLASAPRRLAATMSSLGLGVAVATAIGVFGLSVRTSLETYAVTALPGDVVVSPAGDARDVTAGFPPALVARVRAVPGVLRVDASRTFAVPYGDGTIDVRSNDSLAALSYGEPFDAIVDNAFATRNGVHVNDVFTVLAGGATHRFRIRGIDAGDPLGSGRIDLDDATFARVFSGARPDTLAIVSTPRADVAGVRANVAALFAARAVEVRTTRDLRASLARRLDGVVRATFALAALGTVLATLGIATALSTLVLERRTQIRLVRYAGLSRIGVRAMVLYEAATLGALGGVLGTMLGIALAVTLLATDRSGFGWIVRPVVPFWLPFAIPPVTALIALLAGIVPARRAARLPMQRAAIALVAVVAAFACPPRAFASTLAPERDVWRVLGHLHASDGTRLDVAATFFRYVERGDTGTVTIVASAASLVDEETRAIHTASRVDRTPNDGPSMRAPFDIDVDDWSLHPNGIDERKPAFRLTLRDGSTALEVSMRARERRVDLGASGIVRSGSCAACLVRDAAYPLLDATATRSDAGLRRRYTGTFSLERESGGVRLGDGDRGWQRFTIAFDDGRALFVRVVRTRDGTPRVVGADFVSSAGRRTPLAPSDVHVWNSMHTVWRNDRGIAYPSLFAIIVERVHLHCAVVPDVQNQEIVTQGARYYQGSADVERIDPGPRDRGRAFIELTGYDGGVGF